MSFSSADGRLSPSLRLADGRLSPSLRISDEEIERRVRNVGRARAATTIAETATDTEGTDTEELEAGPAEATDDNVDDEVSSIETNIRKDTEALIGKKRRMTREKRLTLVVKMLERKYQLDTRVQRLTRRLENTKMQTIRLDSRSQSRQLSDRQGNQLLTYAYMIGVAEDKLDRFGNRAVVAGKEAVVEVAWRAIWENEGPGSSHSEKAMVPFLSTRGIHVASDLPRTVVGFAELALQYAHEMHEMLFDEVKKMEIYMRNELKDEVHGVATMDAEALQMAYTAHQLNLAPTSSMVAMAVPVNPTDAPSNLPVTQVEPYIAPRPLLSVELPLDSDDDEAANSVVASISAPVTPAPRDNYFQVLLNLDSRVRGMKRPRLEVENEVCVA
jgi:hypothetical protein